MKMPLLAIALLTLGGCGDLFFGGRTGTDPAGSASETGNDVTAPAYQATWSRLYRDTTILLHVDTLGWKEVESIEFPLPDSTLLAVIALDQEGGVWYGPGERRPYLPSPIPLEIRSYDSLQRKGWTFDLPGTGIRRDLEPSDSWTSRTIPVYANTWLMRLAREVDGKRVVWNVDSTDLSGTLELDLSGLPDSACDIAPGAHGHLECTSR